MIGAMAPPQMRVWVTAPPLAANGTRAVMFLAGYCCAVAEPANAAVAPTTAAASASVRTSARAWRSAELIAIIVVSPFGLAVFPRELVVAHFRRSDPFPPLQRRIAAFWRGCAVALDARGNAGAAHRPDRVFRTMKQRGKVPPLDGRRQRRHRAGYDCDTPFSVPEIHHSATERRRCAW